MLHYNMSSMLRYRKFITKCKMQYYWIFLRVNQTSLDYIIKIPIPDKEYTFTAKATSKESP